MDKYKQDFREIIQGSIEIEAEHDVESEEEFMQMYLKQLLSRSQHASDGTEREIRFVVAYVHDNLEAQDWQERKEYLESA